MKKPVILMAVVSVLVTTALCLHDYMYDAPSVPYTTSQHVTEILTIGPFFSAIIFAVLYLPYLISKSVAQKIKNARGR